MVHSPLAARFPTHKNVRDELSMFAYRMQMYARAKTYYQACPWDWGLRSNVSAGFSALWHRLGRLARSNFVADAWLCAVQHDVDLVD